MESILIMSEFKRSPSKVWWGSENPEWREVSSSPGSQDSGFSDSETSPNLQENSNKNKEIKKSPLTRGVPKDLLKTINSEKTDRNLNENIKEKQTPEKIKIRDGTDKLVKSEPKIFHRQISIEINSINTDPIRKHRYTKHSPKVSRNLFQAKQYKEHKNTSVETHQYSKIVSDEEETSRNLNTSEEATIDDSYSVYTDKNKSSISEENLSTQSLPNFIKVIDYNAVTKLNKTAPGNLEHLEEYEGITSFNNSLSSDSESELEELFNDHLESPKYTSTPKGGKMCHRREKLPLRLLLKYQHQRPHQEEPKNLTTDNQSTHKWLEEIKNMYEQECMTTLQSKSIAADLNQKVSTHAAVITANLRNIILNSKCIEREYENLNGETIHVEPLIQSLTGNILDFLKTYTTEMNSKILKLCDQIKTSSSESALNLVSVLFAIWNDVRQDLLNKEIKNLIKQLESPYSELNLRAVITGITSVSLRNEELVEMFSKADVIPILLILCEKCEGSSLRSLILRALTTMCCNSLSIRHFEKYSGIQIITDTLEESSRPEPEKSEAVALLAQITAPWLEDNHSVKGLQEYSRRLVKHLTTFSNNTKCCQNLLLSVAALANISTMDPKAIKYLIGANTAKILLEAVRSRGPRVSVYVLEQIAILIANLSASEGARKQLVEINAPVALLGFLKHNSTGEDVEKRLQQKSIIGLSRLCGDKTAAQQVVENKGIETLVKLCRERQERFDSDAVLVAALATLRKITDSCGTGMLSAQDSQELVEPKLLDSFLAYSSQNESYV